MRFGATSAARPQWLFVGLGLAIVAATYFFLISTGARGLQADENFNVPGVTSSTNALIALVGYVVGAGLIVYGVARQFTTSTYALIPIAIAINVVLGQIFGSLGLGVYIDSIGTVLVGVLVGPLAGAATGGITNVIWGFFNPVAMPFAVTAIVIGLLAGVFSRLGWFKRVYLVPIAGAITGVVAAAMSAPLSAFIFGGVTDNTTNNALVALFRSQGFSALSSSFFQGLTVDPLDKLITFVIAYLIIIALPARLRGRFSQSPSSADKLPR
jgi:energy-coupling factor transport system substrate-specific component